MTDYLTGDGQLTSEGMQRVMVEASLGIPQDQSKLPDHPAVIAFRAAVTPQIKAIAEAGQVLDLDGAEFPT